MPQPHLRLVVPLHQNCPDLRRRIALATGIDRFAVERLAAFIPDRRELTPVGLAMVCVGGTASLVIDRCGPEHVAALRAARVAFFAISGPSEDEPALYLVQRVRGEPEQIPADHSGRPVVRMVGDQVDPSDLAALAGVDSAQAEILGQRPRRRRHHHQAR